jgi:hypothetical protein
MRRSRPASNLVPWTYELPPEGEGGEGLEGYAVEASAGDRVGSVSVVLRREDELYLAVKRSLPSVRDVRLVPWADVALVDHAAETVRLALSAERLAAMPRLAPGKGVHGRPADAVRVVGLLGLAPDGTASPRLPVRVVASLGLAALGFLMLLATFLVASRPQWQGREFALFAAPAAVLFAAAAGAAGLDRPLRTWRHRLRRAA